MPGTPQTPQVVVRRADERYRTATAGWVTHHSFSTGTHYDPANTSYGLLVLHDEHLVRAGAGFPEHRHQGVEVVTWVLEGSLVHEDSEGHRGVVVPGLVQRMSAGTGVLHSETNDAWRLQGGEPHDEPVRFVQGWVAPDEDEAPEYAQHDVSDALLGGRLVVVASGRPMHDAAVPLRNRSAALHAARLAPDQAVGLPEAPYLHLFVARGSVELEGTGPLGPGDAARIAGGGQRVSGLAPAEVLVWEMHASLSG